MPICRFTLIRLWGVFALIGLCLTLTVAQAEPFTPRVLVIGDSLSSERNSFRGTRWVQILRERLQQHPAFQKVFIVNRSYGGHTLIAALPNLERDIEDDKADIVVLALGTNDAAARKNANTEEWLKRLDKAMQIIEESSAKGILVSTQITKTMQRRSKMGAQLPSLYQQLADNYAWPIAHWSLAKLSAQPGGLMLDGVHPSAKSQPQLADAVWPVLEKRLIELKQRVALTD